MVKAYSNITVITQENFSSIYQDYYDLLMKYIFSILKSKEQAQDIVADLFCEVWNGRDKITVHTNLQNYLLVSARRMANKQLVKNTLNYKYNEPSSTLEIDPHTQFVYKENTALLSELLSGLSPQKQDIIQLRLIGLTYNEIAVALDSTPKKVEYHLSTAICLLHEEIKLKPHLKELAFLLLLPPLMNEVTIW